MNDQYSFNSIDNLLFQFALQTRDLSHKRNEINQQIKVCRGDIAERRNHIEMLHINIKKHEEEIRLKQSAVLNNKANSKSMKATNSLLLQYEQTLKEELENRRASYKHDMEAYEERITSYWKIFQSHKEYYCQNALAQDLLTLHAEKEEIESRIKTCDDQITVKQKELEPFTGPAVTSSSPEKLNDSFSDSHFAKEPEKQSNPQGTDSPVDISTLYLCKTKNSQDALKPSVDANVDGICEESEAQDPTAASGSVSDEITNELWACQQLDEQKWPDVMPTDEQSQEIGPEDQKHQSTESDMEETVEEDIEEDKTPNGEDNEELADFPQSSSPSSAAVVKTMPSTPTFPFNFSPGGSPIQGTSETKSPAFVFSLKSDPSTSGFSGFGFDEDPSFNFTGSFFDEKKTKESKSSTCPDFLFGQPEQSDDFQFAFTSKGPQTNSKDNTKEDFPFSFNF